MEIYGLEKLFPYPEYIIDSVSLSEDLVHVQMHRDRRRRLRCPECGRTMWKKDERQRIVFDIPMLGIPTVWIQYNAVTGRCPDCKASSVFHPKGIDRYSQATQRLKNYVSQLCQYMPASHVPEFVGISHETARRYDKEILEKKVGQPDLENLRYILIDEKAIGKRHKYVTVVLNAENGELLFMQRGKKKETLEAFYAMIPEEKRLKIEAIGTDRHGAYVNASREQCPNAVIVFDRFHLVKNLNTAIDAVRRQEVADAKKEEKRFIKGQRYNLLRHEENLKENQAVKLKDLLAVNENLNTAYVLKEAFHHLYDYVYPANAEKYLRRWCDWAFESGLSPLVSFAQGLLRDSQNIISYFRHQITNGPIEAFNSIIGRIIYQACGIKDLDYLFLKLRQKSAC